jgi:hypothetical protein
MIRIATLLVFLIAGASPVYADMTCNVPFIKFIPGTTSNGYMYVKSGKSCGIQVANSPGGATKSPQVQQRPSNGVLVINGLGLKYTPKKGFVGKDHFEYIRHALDPRNNAPVSGVMSVDVTVQP